MNKSLFPIESINNLMPRSGRTPEKQRNQRSAGRSPKSDRHHYRLHPHAGGLLAGRPDVLDFRDKVGFTL